jgi:hypothetical protein
LCRRHQLVAENVLRGITFTCIANDQEGEISAAINAIRMN